ncbi:ABC transporter ATP-binding protein [Streptomyces sp. JH14]|uniref:ABC transporter ATP-binding protein n=1 Tax=Streptomyces sp. JH14 TaxID=2793630 RepID=UPI0023F999C9|nr:ABC transporter ATP-binding protein [Streptomyces sp. JH14]MDF6046147.1 ABC transporter ATP-binding protein [Streptomyces sp. JH14]
MAAALELRNLGVHLQTLDGEVQAVRDVSLSVAEGEIVGLVGESGSGKSVTSLAIMGLLTPGLSRTTGSVLLNGRDLLTLSPTERAAARGREISMIFQEPMTALDPLFRIGDQISETIRAHQKVSRRAAADRAFQILTDVGIPDAASRLKAYPHQLSGGMRQRVMIAMALVCEPSVLIADEPTTALDVTVQAQILRLLHRLSQEHGTAVLLITHDLGVVAETCSRIHTMYAGEIVEQCSVDQALAGPKHPYTSGLIQAIPRSERRRQPLFAIQGRVPALTAMPPGCRFQPRCSHALEECLAPQPEIRTGDRGVRCCRQDELALAGAVPQEQR